MNINRNNYEIFIIDYFDNNLNNADINTLMHFLNNNPDLKEEFNTFSNASIPAPKINYPNNKSLLKKHIINVGDINEDNFEDFFISYHEGDLSEKEKIDTMLFCEKNPFLKKDFQNFGKTILIPDETIHFENKSQLKKHKRYSIYISSAIAASIIILFGLYNILHHTDTRNEILLSKKNPIYVNTIAVKTSTPAIQKINSTHIQFTPIKNDFPQKETISTINTIHNSTIALEENNSFDKSHDIEMQFDASNEFFFAEIQEDLNYYMNWKEYEDKTLLEKIVYQTKHTLLIRKQENYINDEDLSLKKVAEKSINDINTITNLKEKKVNLKPDFINLFQH